MTSGPHRRIPIGGAVAWLDRLLPVWFAAWSAVRFWQLGFIQLGWEVSWFGRDFRIYRNAAAELFAGRSPLDAFSPWNGVDWHFAAPPTAAQAYLPFALLPEGLGLAVFMAGSVALLVLALRRLGLPWWWLLFPPVMEGLMAGNPQIPVLALLIVAGIPGRVLAGWAKVFAVIPMIARREIGALAALAATLAISVALSPGAWAEYIRRYAEVTARLTTESEGGISAALVLQPRVLPTLAGLLIFGVVVLLVLLAAVRDVRAAGWIAVPLLWPAAEYHYAAFAMPVVRRPSAWLLAVPMIPTYLVGMLLLTWEVTAGRPAIAPQPEPVGLVAWLRGWPGALRGLLRRDTTGAAPLADGA